MIFFSYFQAAVIAGIFDRIIWIYPSWLKKPENDPKYIDTKISLGYITKNSVFICLCEKNFNEISCYYVDTNKDDEDRIVPLEKNECETKLNIQFEIIEENEAVKKFKNTDWLKVKNSFSILRLLLFSILIIE